MSVTANLPNFPQNTVAAGFAGPTYLASLDGDVQSEFQAAYGQLEGWMSADHNADGTHRNIRSVSIQSEKGLLSGLGNIGGGMPSTFATGAVISLVDSDGQSDNFAGFFAITANRGLVTGGPYALQGYSYLTHPSGETIAAAIALLGSLEHGGVGIATLARAIEAEILISNSGGGTTASCFFASMSGRSGSGTGTYTNGIAYEVGSWGAGFTTKYSFRSTDPVAIFQNDGPIVTGNSRTSSGSSTIATATPTTIFSATAPGRYEVYAYSSAAGAANYTAFATVVSDDTNTRIVSNDGSLLTLTLSGNNVQVTQTSGGNLAVSWGYLRIF